jgi:hypothetical protein
LVRRFDGFVFYFRYSCSRDVVAVVVVVVLVLLLCPWLHVVMVCLTHFYGFRQIPAPTKQNHELCWAGPHLHDQFDAFDPCQTASPEQQTKATK